MSRKRNLVEFGFRLPSASTTGPLTWEEFAEPDRSDRVPVGHARTLRTGPDRRRVVEQVIRPTLWSDPKVVVKPTKGQIDDLIGEIRTRAERDERVLVTTLTKKMAEDLTDYLLRWASGCATCTPRSTRCAASSCCASCARRLDVLVGINLLREGSTFLRCPWCRSSTPTRRAFCAPP